MFKMHRRVEYALLALKYMSQKFPGQLTSAKEICDHFHIPFDPTSRVLQLMNQGQIVKAEQGAHGGYQIIQDLSHLSLQDLSDMLVGPIQITDCLQGKNAACEAASTCEITSAMQMLNTRICQTLGALSLAELIEIKSPTKRRVPATAAL